VNPRQVSYWLDRFPDSRRPSWPRQRGALQTSVAIVGGGLTGCASAYTFATAGVPVVLVEADRIGQADGTSGGLGLLRQELDVDFHQVASIYGLRAARALWQGARRAALDFAAALRRLGIGAEPEIVDSITFSRRREDERRLRRELQSRKEAGVEAAWLNAAALRRETAIDGVGGIKAHGNGQIDPYRACLGFARASAARGALIFERTKALRVRARRKSVEIRTTGGMISAETVVLATGYPTDDLRALRRHVRKRHSYVVLTDSMPAAMRREVGKRSAMLRDTEEPAHSLRWMKEDRILFGGGDQPEVKERARAKALVQRSNQLMYELSLIYPAISGIQPTHTWDTSVIQSVDGLPYLGPHRNFPRHLFAYGLGRDGLAFSWLAARIFLRFYMKEPDKYDHLFGFGRILGER
jgi:glycine/D-amino acid oxidase-like deaminating enzyme